MEQLLRCVRRCLLPAQRQLEATKNMRQVIYIYTTLLIVLGAAFYGWFSQPTFYFSLVEVMEREYDFVIVGGGTAGVVLATRLTQNHPHVHVLLLEAGSSGFDVEHLKAPLLWPALNAQIEKGELTHDFVWSYRSEPQRYACLAVHEERCLMPRGKVLGGTSVLGNMLHSRGHREDYHRWWNELEHGEEWSYEQLLPYFIKSEEEFGFTSSASTCKLPDKRACNYNESQVEQPSTRFSTGANAFVQAFHRHHHHPPLKLQQKNLKQMFHLGVDFNQMLLRFGIRQSVATAFLLPSALQRPNLHVALGALAQRILVTNRVARGVQFSRQGQLHEVRASREVLLSAGSLNSPQLLMLSGIGPRKQLELLDIPLQYHLAGVGANLRDQIFTTVEFYTNQSHAVNADESNLLINKIRYWLFRTGPIAENHLQASAYFKVENSSRIAPEVQVDFFATLPCANAGSDSTLCTLLNLKDKARDVMMNMDKTQRHGFTLLLTLLKPQSKGYVRLGSSKAHISPIIQPNYLSDSRDIKVLRNALRVVMSLEHSREFVALNATLKLRHFAVRNQQLPFCAHHVVKMKNSNSLNFNSSAFLDCYLRHYSYGGRRPSGTCHMGHVSSNDSVVDSHLRVHGVSRLRVVDSSVIPEPLSTTSHSPTTMIAEKAADLILREQAL